MFFLLQPVSPLGAFSQVIASYLTGAVMTASGVYANEPDGLVAFTRHM